MSKGPSPSYDNAKALLAQAREGIEEDPLEFAAIFATLSVREALVLQSVEIRKLSNNVAQLASSNETALATQTLNKRLQDLTDVIESLRGETPVTMESYKELIDAYIEREILKTEEE